MQRTKFIIRLSVALTLITVSVLFVALGLGLIPDQETLTIASRSELVRALAVQAAASVQADAPRQFEDAVRPLIDESSELLSAGLRDIKGVLTLEINDHGKRWVDPGEHSTIGFVWVSIDLNESTWGKAEFCFRPISTTVSARRV